MSGRNLDAALAGGLGASVVCPAILAMLTFASATKYVWTGIGTLSWNGNNFDGMGSFATVGGFTEGTEVNAAGTNVGLSGIDSVLLTECISDIRLGAPAKLWFGLMANNVLLGTPYQMFSGQVDKPAISIGSESSTIALALENRMVNLQRPSNRRYTAADQHLVFPDDTAFNWQEIMNDVALKWGMS